MSGEIEIEILDEKKGLKFRVKGSPELVDEYIKKFGAAPLIQAIGNNVANSVENQEKTKTTIDITGPGLPDKPDAGSISQYVVKLMLTEWGQKGRTLNQIQDAARTHGVMVSVSSLSGIMSVLNSTGKLKRLKNPGDSQWVYYPPTAWNAKN